MKVSMKVDYGVRALIDLAQHYGRGSVQTSEIAARQGVPEPYLDQLLTTLRKAGLIKSRRGPQGGHVLAKDPNEMALGAVFQILEGSMPPIDCMDGSMECAMSRACVQQDVWRSVEEAAQSVLNSTTIGELALRQMRRKGSGMYYI